MSTIDNINALLPDNTSRDISEKDIRDSFKILHDNLQQSINSEATTRTNADALKLDKPKAPNNTSAFVVLGDGSTTPAGDLGKNISNADLATTAERTFTQNAPYKWDTQGNPYSLKGLTDKTGDISYRKVLKVNTTTKEIGEGDATMYSVTMPSTVNYNVNHIYPNPVPPIEQNLQDVKTFMEGLPSFVFTQMQSSDFVSGSQNGATVVNANNLILINGQSAGNSSTTQASVQSNTITFPSNKNWVFCVQVSNAVYYNSLGMAFGFNRTSNPAGIQSPEIAIVSQPSTEFGIKVNGKEITRSNSNATYFVMFTKVGNVLNISVFGSDGTSLSENIDATNFIGNYRPVFCCGSSGSWAFYPSYTNMRYYIQP